MDDHARAPDQVFQALLLEMAQQRSCASLLDLVVQRLAQRPQIALARLWLLEPGDLCAECYLREECRDRSLCLHLKASAGVPREEGADWSRIDGAFRRFPIGVRKVGHIAATAEPVEIRDIAEDARWIARPEWAQSEGIRGFGGQPLIYRGQVLGVLAVFTRVPLVQRALAWLRMIADHAAISIANARAFEEIDRLRAVLEQENGYLREEVHEAHAFGELVGQSPALRSIVEQIDQVAPTTATVLITGESGTGKELVAREIHARSDRGDRPLIKVNCASIPRDLYESEFFGHARGAFTGAVAQREGRFAAADGGTLLLDEVGEIPLELQSKLLRVLQEGQYERVGEERTRQADVRVIAATNRDLRQEVDGGRFRQDLFYRLNVFPIEAPPLRERLEDIPLLVPHILALAARRLHRAPPRLTEAHLRRLQAHDWPGNVRELQNTIERALITSRDGGMHFDLPAVRSASQAPSPRAAPSSAAVVPEDEMRQRERDNLLAALQQSDWKISGPGGAAELLGLRPTTLAYRLKKLGLRRPRSDG